MEVWLLHARPAEQLTEPVEQQTKHILWALQATEQILFVLEAFCQQRPPFQLCLTKKLVGHVKAWMQEHQLAAKQS